MMPLLGFIFIVLKLTEVVSWSWVWVLSPWWIGFCCWAFGEFINSNMKSPR